MSEKTEQKKTNESPMNDDRWPAMVPTEHPRWEEFCTRFVHARPAAGGYSFGYGVTRRVLRRMGFSKSFIDATLIEFRENYGGGDDVEVFLNVVCHCLCEAGTMDADTQPADGGAQ
jgi:hypothetical protein